ncbi:hypothetical protein [Chromobacterium amazonense]|uniref:Uncharacterized protein n=1 Tax=Chromobacterium amazonense TaxID=1382803 RepID=A0ABU8V5K6_9NEIS|nr:hypothetical protein [Chromobacterium amazonense]MDQ4539298.1 hypothetical protein [Chromobacterium amazonense]
MQYALCTADGTVWESSNFASLPADQLETKRKSLVCSQCSEFAWFRKESSHGHPAHFCAHHREDCDLRVEYVVINEPRNGTNIAEGELQSGDLIIVRLDQEQGSQIDVTEVQPPPGPGATGGGRTFILRNQGQESAQHFTLRRILLRLVQSPTFRQSDTQIVFYKNERDVLISGQVRDIVASFADITREMQSDQLLLYWGPIASAGRTPDGKIWLNSSASNQETSVSIFEDVADEFLSAFGITDLDELAGAHVLVAGRVHFTSTGKPVIWCGSSKYIVVRRYRAAGLQALL